MRDTHGFNIEFIHGPVSPLERYRVGRRKNQEEAERQYYDQA